MTGKSIFSAIISFLLLCGVGGGLLAATAIPVTAMTGSAANAVTRIFDDLPSEVTFTEPSEQSRILASDGSLIARFYSENRIIVESDQISPYIKNAAVAIEDERFYQHNGIDAQGLIGAAVNNLTGGNLAGGSTITQQYVKNAMIEEGRNQGDTALIDQATERTITRKLNEARYAIAVENQMSKDEILTGYLNLAQFGPSQWGVEAASRYYFSVPASKVTLEQAAMLAGITQAPGRWDPVNHPEEAKTRRDTVLSQMYKLDMITKPELDAAAAVSIDDMLNVTKATNGCAAAGNRAYFCEYVVKEVLNSPILGETREERTQLLYRGGLNITTTLDMEAQAAAYEALITATPVNDPSGISMAMSAVEPGTGHIKSMAQNTVFGEASKEDPNQTKLNLNVGQDMGGGSGFQSGSTFKAFTLVQWLKDGHSAKEVIPAGRMTFQPSSWNISCSPRYARGEPYSPRNIEGIGTSRMAVEDVIRMSINTASVYMGNQLDLCDVAQTAEDLGLRRGEIAREGYAATTQVQNMNLDATMGEPLPIEPFPSMLLGVNTVTPLSQANAMATLGAEGQYCEPIAFTKITDRSGNLIGEQKSECKQVLDKETARQATEVLERVLEPTSTGYRAALEDQPAAGKTGTANNDTHAWFMGYTPQLASAIWQGHMNQDISMMGATINGEQYTEVYGGLFPAQVFKQYMDTALADTPTQNFTPPTKKNESKNDNKDNNDQGGVTVPNVIGKNQQNAYRMIQEAGFGYTTSTEYSDKPRGLVSSTSPGPDSKAPRGSIIQINLSDGPDPNGGNAADQSGGQNDPAASPSATQSDPAASPSEGQGGTPANQSEGEN